MLTVASAVATAVGAAFSFDAPVSSSSPSGNFVRCAGLSVTLFGVGFAEFDITATMLLTQVMCWSTAWTTNTQVRASVGSTDSAAKLTVMVASVLSTGPGASAFSFDAPVASYQIHDFNGAPAENFPHTRELSVTIVGFNFEQTDPTPTVVTGMQALSASWTSATSLSMHPRFSGPSLAVGLSAVWSPSRCTFTYNAPVLSSMSSNNAPPVFAVSITMLGAEFMREDLTPSARMGEVFGLGQCRTTSWSTSTSVRCATGFGNELPASANLFYPRSALTIAPYLSGTSSQPFVYEGCGCMQPGSKLAALSNYGATGGRCMSTSTGARRRYLDPLDHSPPSQSAEFYTDIGDCSCRSNYSTVTCGYCAPGYAFDPGPFCKSGNCAVTLWEAWSECSLSCGWRSGVVQRTRAVTFPGLLACPFALAEQESCMPPPCETHAPMRTWSADGGWINGIDCALSGWSNWDACEVSCGGGFTKRTKSVLTPAAGEGTPCPPVCTDRIVLLSGVSVNC